MIKKFLKPIRNNHGSGYPMALAILLALVIMVAGISEYFRLMIITQGIRDALQDAVISTTVENYDEVYHGVREGYSGGYQPLASDFEEALDYGDIYDKMDKILSLSVENGYHVKEAKESSQVQFRIWNLQVDIQNAPLAAGDKKGNRSRWTAPLCPKFLFPLAENCCRP